MATHLSIKSVPDVLVERLRRRAERNHRSLQGELMTLLEDNLMPKPALSPQEALAKLRQIDLKTNSEARQMIRKDRNER